MYEATCHGLGPDDPARRRVGVGPAGDDRAAWPRHRFAGRGIARRDSGRAQPGNRHVPRDRVGEDGTFIASGIVPGTYQVTAELQGFKKFDRKDLRLEVGKTSSIDVTMAVGAVEETVVVRAESPLVDVTSKEIGGNITSETLVKLPSVNGNFVGFVGLLPGIVPRSAPSRSAAIRSASTARIRATTITCSTAATTTTT